MNNPEGTKVNAMHEDKPSNIASSPCKAAYDRIDIEFMWCETSHAPSWQEAVSEQLHLASCVVPRAYTGKMEKMKKMKKMISEKTSIGTTAEANVEVSIQDECGRDEAQMRKFLNTSDTHPLDGSVGTQTIHVDALRGMASIQDNNVLSEWNGIMDYKNALLAVKLFSKMACVLAKMDLAVFPSLDDITQALSKQASGHYPPTRGLTYTVLPSRVKNLAQYGVPVKDLCRTVPAYFAQQQKEVGGKSAWHVFSRLVQGIPYGARGEGKQPQPHQKAKASYLLMDLMADGHPAPTQALPCPWLPHPRQAPSSSAGSLILGRLPHPLCTASYVQHRVSYSMEVALPEPLISKSL
ncbi:gastrokine 3 [Cricetulus griseus]